MAEQSFELPQSGFTFWNVGTGDSTIVSIDDQHIVLVDIRHLESAEQDDDPRIPIIDYLVDNLPRLHGGPYLAIFVLTHPDKDHCQGFAELIERVHVGELWFAPRVLDEYDEDLCDDAQAFVDEAQRRIGAIAAEGLKSGNRLRIIGSADVLDESPYDKIPEDLVTVPGSTVSLVDGDDLSGSFEAFVHAPFKDDAEAERNETSVGMRVSLCYGTDRLQALLLGDLSNPTLNRIFDVSAPANTSWDVLLAPHHCSKSTMYYQDGDDEVLDKSLMKKLEGSGSECRYIVPSSDPIPSKNKPGDNPPHAKAKSQYEQIVDLGHFLCTGEHGSKDGLTPVSFAVGEIDCGYTGSNADSESSASARKAVADARGNESPPGQSIRFGQWP